MKTFKIILLHTIAILLISCGKNEPNITSISTLDIKNISPYSAECGGNISEDGILPILYRGICWSKKEYPTLADNYLIDDLGFGSYTSIITNISANSKYYVRAYYINMNDTVFGNQVEFTTPDYIIFNPDLKYGSVTDVDGNKYKTITIGTQTWMAENLKTTHFQNGEQISNITDLSKWGHFQIRTSAYCWYDNDRSNKDIYGALYNWYAASDDRNIAPSGWHVASIDDWQTLKQFVGFNYYGFDGGKLRETTTSHWLQFISPATNETGFTALPGGKVVSNAFLDKGAGYAYFWTKTGTLDGSSCIYLSLDVLFGSLAPNCRGFNVRCVKD